MAIARPLTDAAAAAEPHSEGLFQQQSTKKSSASVLFPPEAETNGTDEQTGVLPDADRPVMFEDNKKEEEEESRQWTEEGTHLSNKENVSAPPDPFAEDIGVGGYIGDGQHEAAQEVEDFHKNRYTADTPAPEPWIDQTHPRPTPDKGAHTDDPPRTHQTTEVEKSPHTEKKEEDSTTMVTSAPTVVPLPTLGGDRQLEADFQKMLQVVVAEGGGANDAADEQGSNRQQRHPRWGGTCIAQFLGSYERRRLHIEDKYHKKRDAREESSTGTGGNDSTTAARMVGTNPFCFILPTTQPEIPPFIPLSPNLAKKPQPPLRDDPDHQDDGRRGGNDNADDASTHAARQQAAVEKEQEDYLRRISANPCPSTASAVAASAASGKKLDTPLPVWLHTSGSGSDEECDGAAGAAGLGGLSSDPFFEPTLFDSGGADVSTTSTTNTAASRLLSWLASNPQQVWPCVDEATQTNYEFSRPKPASFFPTTSLSGGAGACSVPTHSHSVASAVETAVLMPGGTYERLSRRTKPVVTLHQNDLGGVHRPSYQETENF